MNIHQAGATKGAIYAKSKQASIKLKLICALAKQSLGRNQSSESSNGHQVSRRKRGRGAVGNTADYFNNLVFN